MQFLTDLLRANGHKLTHYTQAIKGHEYMSVFRYSAKHGGTLDGFRYYNDYVIDITEGH